MKKKVTFEYEFVFDDEHFDDFSDKAIEQHAFETLYENFQHMGEGKVETIQQ